MFLPFESRYAFGATASAYSHSEKMTIIVLGLGALIVLLFFLLLIMEQKINKIEEKQYEWKIV